MRRAVELDPTFALAHARLGTIYANLLDTEASRRHATRAFELRDKVSELERLYIEARYYTTGQADPAKAIEAYRVAIGTYPTDYASRTNLAILLKERGELEESLALLREATRLAPEEPSARFNLAGGLLEMGQFDEARAEMDRLLSVRDNGASRAAADGAGRAARRHGARGPAARVGQEPRRSDRHAADAARCGALSRPVPRGRAAGRRAAAGVQRRRRAHRLGRTACRHCHQPGHGRRRRPRAGADGAAARRRLRRPDRRRAAGHRRAHRRSCGCCPRPPDCPRERACRRRIHHGAAADDGPAGRRRSGGSDGRPGRRAGTTAATPITCWSTA